MADLEAGQQFAGYTIDAEIGRGGMGVVYRARDRALGRDVAIKVIGEDRADSDLARQRFEREARLMAAIDHPNVIPIYGAGECDGHLYLVMRYVQGTDLHKLLRERGRLTPELAARIVDQVARAVQAAHENGLVHRDIKPGNVLLHGEAAYLADFGITRLIDQRTRSTDSGQWIGTVDFMSPEQLRGEQVDQLSDIYSLGALLYTCLVGTPPFHRDSAAATIAAQLHERPPQPSLTEGVSKRFDKVISRALAKRPAGRYQSAAALGAAALDAAAPRRRGLRRRGVDVAGAVGQQPVETALPALPPVATAAVPSAAGTVVQGEGKVDAVPPAEPPTPDLAPAAEPTSHSAATVIDGAAADGGLLVPRTEIGVEPVLERPSSGTGAGAQMNRRRAQDGSARRRFGMRSKRGTIPLVLALAAIAAVAAGGYELLRGGGTKPLAQLSVSQLDSAAQSFATAYSRHDSKALAALLAADVTRVDPAGSQRGRAAVLANYEAQFATSPAPRSYRLADVVTQTGWAPRVSASYTLALSNGTNVSGHVVFGLQRAGERAQIGLIVTR